MVQEDLTRILKTHPSFAPLMRDCDHVDIKSFHSTNNLSAFVASLFNWSPWWVRLLFSVRAVFVRLLGMKQPTMTAHQPLREVDVPFEAGAPIGFFTVHAGEAERFHISAASDKHLIAFMGILVVHPSDGAEPVGTGQIFLIATIVKYLHWTGPLYFNVIRPFHHLVVRQMGRAASRPTRP